MERVINEKNNVWEDTLLRKQISRYLRIIKYHNHTIYFNEEVKKRLSNYQKMFQFMPH